MSARASTAPRRPAFGSPLVPLRDGVELVAPGGVFVRAERTLVVADVHVGFGTELRSRGYAVPAGDDDELLARVQRMLARTEATRLVIAGDVVHGPGSARPHNGGPSPVSAFFRAISPIEVIAVLGNHDRRAAHALEAAGAHTCKRYEVGPHVVEHGDVVERVHEARSVAMARGGRVLVGHLHPALSLGDGVGARATVPAFVSARGLLCLPALTPNARGGDVRSATLRAQLDALAPGEAMGAAVVVDDRVMVLGDVFSAG